MKERKRMRDKLALRREVQEKNKNKKESYDLSSAALSLIATLKSS